MTTLGAVLNAVKDNLEIADSDKDATINGFARTALRQLRKKRYWFLLKRTNLTLTASTNTVILPTDYSTIESVNMQVGGVILTKNTGFALVNYDDFYAEYLTTTTVPSGDPTGCTVLDNVSESSILFNRAPTANRTVPITYYVQDATLPTASGDVSVWGDDGFDLWRALTQLLYQRYAQNDTAAATDEVTLYTQILNSQNDFNLPII
jgi:hypothetical protein